MNSIIGRTALVDRSAWLSRRQLLRRTICSIAWLRWAGASSLLARPALAATLESPETENNWEGPYYKPGAPVRSVLVERGMAGAPLTVRGRVLDTHGRPIRGALLEVWQADHSGIYDNAGFRLRGRLYTSEDGEYVLRTIKPQNYGEPGDMRAAHIHVKASCERSRVLTTQLYFKGDPWNRRDPAVRPSLILSPRQDADGLTARFDFVIRVG